MLSGRKGLKLNKSGFTLIEVLVVVTILAILMSLTIPNYLRTRPMRLLGAQANKIGQMVRFTRLQAIRDNEKYYMEFIPELDMYRIWGRSGWYAYADPDRLNGDWDNDGDDFTDGEDADILDGVVDDPDILLNPLHPDNLPIHTHAPRLLFDVQAGVLVDISRDFENDSYVADQSVFPFDIDLRMDPLKWGDPEDTDILTRPTWTPNVNVLSRGPLLFMVFFPDGTVGSSWSFDQVNPGLADEIRDLQGGELGITEIFLQVRGNVNPAAHDLYPDPSGGNFDGSSDGYSPYQTLEFENSISESFGRRVLINHATGRIKVENFIPANLDDPLLTYF